MLGWVPAPSPRLREAGSGESLKAAGLGETKGLMLLSNTQSYLNPQMPVSCPQKPVSCHWAGPVAPSRLGLGWRGGQSPLCRPCPLLQPPGKPACWENSTNVYSSSSAAKKSLSYWRESLATVLCWQVAGRRTETFLSWIHLVSAAVGTNN